MERDSQKLWQLMKSLNGDNSVRGRTTLQTTNGAVTGKAAANVLARVFEEESTVSPSADSVKDVRTQTRAVLQNTATAGFDPCMTECLTLRELEEALKKMKKKKAPGPDGITNEMLKHLGPGAKRTLLHIYNQSWSTGTVPTIWKEVVIRPIPKREKTSGILPATLESFWRGSSTKGFYGILSQTQFRLQHKQAIDKSVAPKTNWLS